MKLRFTALSLFLFWCCSVAYAQNVKFEITTNLGTLKGFLYDDVPNHTKTFIKNAQEGAYNNTLFTRVIPGFMIQGGAADSRGAAPGVRVGAGDRSKEIMPESSKQHFYKKGALAAPRQEKFINPQNKSDMSQFFIIQGKVYTAGKLDTLELANNNPIKKKALQQLYAPIKEEMEKLKKEDPKAYNAKAKAINAAMDSILMASPKKLFFTNEQRESYTTIGGLPTWNEDYTIYGEITEGLEHIDQIADQPKDKFDRPKKDMKIIKVTIIK